MTAALGVDVGMGIEAGLHAGAALGIGQSQAAGPGVFGKSATHETSEPSVSGAESFRSRWEAMVNALETGPGASLKAGQGTITGTKQATAVFRSPSRVTEIESTGENRDGGKGIGNAQNTALPKFANDRSEAAPTIAANTALEPNGATEQTNGPLATTTRATPVLLENVVSERTLAVAPHKESAQNSDDSVDSHAGRSVKSDRRSNTSQQTNATASNGPPATLIDAAANPAASAAAIETQILAANSQAAPQTNLGDVVLKANRDQDDGESEAAKSVRTSGVSHTGTAGMAVRTGINPLDEAGNPAMASTSGSQDSKASGVVIASQETASSRANQQTVLPGRIEAEIVAAQQEPAASQQHTGSGNSLVGSAKAISATHQELNPGVARSYAFISQSRVAATAAEKPDFDGARQLPEGAVTRTSHRDTVGEITQPATQAVLTEQAGADVAASGLVRVPMGTEGAVSATATHAGATAGAAPGTAGQETFAAIDAGTGVGTPGWIHAGGHTAEAGFQDPALGWVGVRADLSGGNVHAALLPGSAEAAQTLSGHLSGLNVYLAEQHTPVATLTLGAERGGGIETSSGQSMQQGAGQHLNQETERNTSAQSQASLQPGTATIPAAARGTRDESDGFNTAARTGEMRGRHISVMA